MTRFGTIRVQSPRAPVRRSQPAGSVVSGESFCLYGWAGEMNIQVMAATLIVLALALLSLAPRSRKKTGIREGDVFYSGPAILQRALALECAGHFRLALLF